MQWRKSRRGEIIWWSPCFDWRTAVLCTDFRLWQRIKQYASIFIFQILMQKRSGAAILTEMFKNSKCTQIHFYSRILMHKCSGASIGMLKCYYSAQKLGNECDLNVSPLALLLLWHTLGRLGDDSLLFLFGNSNHAQQSVPVQHVDGGNPSSNRCFGE